MDMKRLFYTADLCDTFTDELMLVHGDFKAFGQVSYFHGPLRTVKCFEDNSKVRELLSQDGNGAVIIVDGGASANCALVGDRLVQLALDNDWAGIIVNGAIRDSRAINNMPMSVKALHTSPVKSIKRNQGIIDCKVTINGTVISSDDYAYADEDGILISSRSLIT